jgi:hypothetical protein
MRSFILAILLFGAFLNINGQPKQIDSLIAQLNNRLIVAGGDFIRAKLEFRDSTIFLLESIGKPVTNKLYSLLDDTSRGVAAHLVLSFIYQPNSWPKMVYLEKQELTQYTVGSLIFLIDQEKAFASKEKLIRNKTWWKHFLSKGSR